MTEKRFIILDKDGKKHAVVFSEAGVRFPTYSNRFSHELRGLVDAEEDPLEGPLAVVAIVEKMGRDARVLGPDWVELWTLLGWDEKVQQSLRVTYRGLLDLRPKLNEWHQQLALEQMRDLRKKMTQESLMMMDWEDSHG